MSVLLIDTNVWSYLADDADAVAAVLKRARHECSWKRSLDLSVGRTSNRGDRRAAAPRRSPLIHTPKDDRRGRTRMNQGAVSREPANGGKINSCLPQVHRPERAVSRSRRKSCGN